MKSKKIPVDIIIKSIKEAQSEINDILEKLEDSKTNLVDSIDKYNRVLHLNNHIKDQFKKQISEVKNSNLKKSKNSV